MNSKKKSIVVALMVAMFLAAVEGTIVTIAVPTIAKDLHGFEIISLVFSAYLFTSAISTPIYGKLSDMFGRKNVLSIGIVIFLAGSLMCGLSQTMYMLIIFRAVQGLGAGSIFTVSYTIIGDVFTVEERTKVQGGLGTVWGIASLAGPFLGGFLIDVLSWHWIFFINIPFGILSIILLQNSLKENVEKKRHQIDYAGTVALSVSMIIFLNIFLSDESLGLNRTVFVSISMALTLVLLVVFYLIEKKAKEPIFPLDIFTKTSVLVNSINFLVAAIMIGAEVYLPIYLQNVLGYNATISGLTIAPMSLTWLLASVALGKLIGKIGEKGIILISNVIILISTVLLNFLDVNSSLPMIIMVISIMGIGFGGAFTMLTIVVQSSVEYHKRGAAVAANSLLKTLGQTIGIGIFGGIFNFYIVKYFSNIGISGIDSSNLYASSVLNTLVTSEQIKLSLNSALGYLYITLVALSVLCIILTILTPKIKCDEMEATSVRVDSVV